MRFLLIFFITATTLLGVDLPVMLKVKADFNLSNKVITTFRSGAEDSLTAQGYMLISQEQQLVVLKMVLGWILDLKKYYKS